MITATISILLGALALSISVAASLGIVAFALMWFFTSAPLDRMVGEVAWQSMSSDTLVAIPFFILLGELLLRAGIAERMYGALVEWLSWLPGGTMHANIGACALFAASSGSSVATAATIGTVSIPEIEKHGYSQRLFLGSLTAGGTLGILIPPSVSLIVYGALTETSIPRLYMASMLPGVVLAGLFMLLIAGICIMRPAAGGRPVETSWKRRIRAIPDLFPPLFIFGLVVITIYVGIATPTEAAAFGVVGALGLAAMHRRVTVAMLTEAIEGTMRTTAMVTAIIMTALLLNFVMTFLGISRQIVDVVVALDLSPTMLMLAIVAFYLVLGCFMEGFSILLVTVPIIVPIVVSLGYDSIWFGVVLTLLLEAALITPPIGMNLYVVQGVRKGGPLSDVIMGSLPFVAIIFLMILILMAFPNLALWLPSIAFDS
ncbi:TRAP transporter large permease [Ciceribacter azotifigens]|uniref:TRAP transporter large permease n=1 Tax=Ciceribacter azotifigens TaxID=2069303 RepID=UPI003A8501B3